MFGLLLAVQRKCFQTCGDHQLKIPLGKDWVGILPVQDLALLGDARLSRETSRRLSEDRSVRRASAAPNRATAAVEESKLHSGFLGGAMQLAMRFVQLPCAGKHAAVFVGVKVAEHDFLPASPGIKQRLILGIAPKTAHDTACGSQRFDGLE